VSTSAPHPNPIAQDVAHVSLRSYPKETPLALAEHVEKNNLQGDLRFSLFGAFPAAARSFSRLVSRPLES